MTVEQMSLDQLWEAYNTCRDGIKKLQTAKLEYHTEITRREAGQNLARLGKDRALDQNITLPPRRIEAKVSQ